VKNFSRFISDEHCGLTLAANGKMSIFAEDKSGVQISTPNDFASRLFDIRVPADVIRRNAKAEGKLSLTAD
jgi:hypothetical protein